MTLCAQLSANYTSQAVRWLTGLVAAGLGIVPDDSAMLGRALTPHKDVLNLPCLPSGRCIATNPCCIMQRRVALSASVGAEMLSQRTS